MVLVVVVPKVGRQARVVGLSTVRFSLLIVPCTLTGKAHTIADFYASSVF